MENLDQSQVNSPKSRFIPRAQNVLPAWCLSVSQEPCPAPCSRHRSSSASPAPGSWVWYHSSSSPWPRCHLMTRTANHAALHSLSFSKGWGRNAAQGCRNVSLSAAAIPIGLSTSPRTPSDIGPLPPSSPLPRFPNSFGKYLSQT